MARLDDDLGALLHANAVGTPIARVKFSSEAAVCVVMTAPGYPGAYESGAPISGLDAVDASAADDGGVVVFHAGTRRDEQGRIVTSGGRVLGVTATGADVAAARTRAYAAVGKISFKGAHYRRDIGARPR
jgi:phosphoribosylamine--glycine ligase